MGLLTPGRYKARVVSCGIRPKGSNNLACFSAMLEGVEFKNAQGEYEPIPEGYSIIEDFYLEKKPESGGGLSEETIKRLAKVFEWNGDPTSLVATATDALCKITVEDETYQGKTRARVRWVNHINDGDGGSFTMENNDAIAGQLKTNYGSQIRAILGSTTTTTTTRPPSASAGPPRPAATTPPVSRPPVQLATAESVWEAFGKMCRAELKDATNEVAQDNWFHFLKEVYGTDDAAQITNWNQALVSIVDFKDKLLPF